MKTLHPNLRESTGATSSGSPARWVAYRVLEALESHAELDALEAVRQRGAQDSLSEADRRLASALVLAVLRHKLSLAAQVSRYTKTPLEKIPAAARLLLLMVAAQRFYLERIPPYAAVSDAVAMAKALGLSQPTCKFINAVGRRLAEQQELILPSSPATPTELALHWSLPPWLIQRFLETWGRQKTEKLCSTLNDEAPVTVRVNTLRTTPDELRERWAASGMVARSGVFLPEALTIESPHSLGQLLTHETFHEGLFYIQDEASQLVAHFVAPQPAERLLDLCAAPGGKTTHVAELARRQATIHATDRDPHRLQKLRENIERLGAPGITILPFEEVERSRERILGDSREAAECHSLYDAVLVDAPCSALGTIRHQPEVRWRVTPLALKKLAKRQRALLEFAAPFVRRGGRLIYATCSPLPEENEGVIDDFCRQHPEFSPHTELPPVLAEVARAANRPVFATWPDWPHLEGFSICVLRRTDDH